MTTQPDADPTPHLASAITDAVLAAPCEQSLRRLVQLLRSGADVHALDARGSNAITRFALDARQVVPGGFGEATVPEHLREVVGVLLEHGADPDAVDPRWGQSVRERLGTSPVAALLRRPGADAPRPG